MENFLGSITMFAFNWAPQGYASCHGQMMAISQNAALYSLLGTHFGGDGTTTFALPDLRGRAPVGEGQGRGLPARVLGQAFGADSVALREQNLAPHMHTIGEQQANQTAVLHAKDAAANKIPPAGHYLAAADTGSSGVKTYSDATPDATLASDAVTINAGNLIANNTGGGQPFPVDQPSLVVGYAICTNGLYPSRP